MRQSKGAGGQVMKGIGSDSFMIDQHTQRLAYNVQQFLESHGDVSLALLFFGSCRSVKLQTFYNASTCCIVVWLVEHPVEHPVCNMCAMGNVTENAIQQSSHPAIQLCFADASCGLKSTQPQTSAFEGSKGHYKEREIPALHAV